MGVDGWEFRGRSAFHEASETLVVADVHVGRDEESSVQFPLGERADLADRLRDCCSYFDPVEVVFAGDVLHSFADVSRGSRESVAELAAVCRDVGADPVFLAGNHDAHLGRVWDGPVADTYRLGDVLVCHGHEHPDESASQYVFGHDHPTIRIEGERRPCFLAGPGGDDGVAVLVLPAFNRLTPGVEVNRMGADDFQSPLVVDADSLCPGVYDDASQEMLWLPVLSELREHL